MTPLLEEFLRDAEERGRRRDEAADLKRAAGERVGVDDSGEMPSYLAQCKALGRGREYFVYYSHASLMSHPSIFSLDSVVAERDGVVVPAEDGLDRRAAGMALFLTRTTLARLVLRAARLRADVAGDLVRDLERYMGAAGIPETGVIGLE
jgi:hypothetical protein